MELPKGDSNKTYTKFNDIKRCAKINKQERTRKQAPTPSTTIVYRFLSSSLLPNYLFCCWYLHIFVRPSLSALTAVVATSKLSIISEQLNNWNKTKTYKNVSCALLDTSAVISRTNKEAASRKILGKYILSFSLPRRYSCIKKTHVWRDQIFWRY